MTSQRRSKFQNCVRKKLEPKFGTKVIIVSDFNIFTASCKWYTNLSLFFEMMASQYRTIISKLRENSFINKYHTSKSLLLLIFCLSVTISPWNSSLSSFSSQFRVDDVTMLSVHLREPATFDFNLSINISTWNTNIDLFGLYLGWWRHHGKSKLQNFEIVVSKTNTSPQISLYYWLSSFVQVWALFDPILG